MYFSYVNIYLQSETNKIVNTLSNILFASNLKQLVDAARKHHQHCTPPTQKVST